MEAGSNIYKKMNKWLKYKSKPKKIKERFWLVIITEKVDGQTEANLVVQALRINTLSKLTFSDSIRFDALLKDVFQNVKFKDIEYDSLAKAIREVCVESNLVTNDNQVRWASFFFLIP